MYLKVCRKPPTGFWLRVATILEDTLIVSAGLSPCRHSLWELNKRRLTCRSAQPKMPSQGGFPPMLGKIVSDYRIREKLGAGGIGVVYRPRDERLDRDVALKVLPAGALADEAARKRFRKVALALAKLSHPNIGMIFDCRHREWHGPPSDGVHPGDDFDRETGQRQYACPRSHETHFRKRSNLVGAPRNIRYRALLRDRAS